MPCSRQHLLRGVAVAPYAHRVLVIDVPRTIGDRRGDHLGDPGIEELGVRLALLGPLRQLAELDPTDRGRDVGQPHVGADDLVGVPLLHALVAQEPERPRDLGVVRW